MWKDDPNVHVFQNKTDVAQNLIDKFFSNFDCQILNEKKDRGTWLISEKTEAFYVKLNEKVEAATSSYSAPGDFYSIFILCLCLRIKRRSVQGV